MNLLGGVIDPIVSACKAPILIPVDDSNRIIILALRSVLDDSSSFPIWLAVYAKSPLCRFLLTGLNLEMYRLPMWTLLIVLYFSDLCFGRLSLARDKRRIGSKIRLLVMVLGILIPLLNWLLIVAFHQKMILHFQLVMNLDRKVWSSAVCFIIALYNTFNYF
jgi:hypothetical protein